METYQEARKIILEITRDFLELFGRVRSKTDLYDQSFQAWERTCGDIAGQSMDEIMRVAVIGPIKSGKSTFVNSIFGMDFLKRGAGVVTSIVTKIRKGDQMRAQLFFKSWDEINREIRQALALFPELNEISDPALFDIRKENEREALKKALDAVQAKTLTNGDTIDRNVILLKSCLNGFNRVSTFIESDRAEKNFRGNDFTRHMDFSGDDSLAVYLDDICLEITSDSIDAGIEIADCQGSDSPNPMHLAMIQDYLTRANIMLYVISGRTGVRRADFRFLKIIEKMGIIDNLFFIVNFDFDEHDTPEDLSRVTKKIREELAFVVPNPNLFVFSALFNLFASMDEKLPEKDRRRYLGWKEREKLARFSLEETRRFQTFLKEKLFEKRFDLLLKSHIGRMKMVSSSLKQWVKVHTDLIEQDTQGIKQSYYRIEKEREKIAHVRSMIKNTLEGALKELRTEMKNAVDGFFDLQTGAIPQKLFRFIRGYQFSEAAYLERVETSGFSHTLYILFQEFKGKMEEFMTETINPDIFRFTRDMEKMIGDRFKLLTTSYSGMFRKNPEIHLFQDTAREPDAHDEEREGSSVISLPDSEWIRNMASISTPSAMASARFSASVRTEAIARLGVYSLANYVRKMLKKPIKKEKAAEARALKKGLIRMKKETEISAEEHLKNYKENLKYQYLFKYAETLSNYLFEILTDQFNGFFSDITTVCHKLQEKEFDRKAAREILDETIPYVEEIDRKIERLCLFSESSGFIDTQTRQW